jgi:hypothetical protein
MPQAQAWKPRLRQAKMIHEFMYPKVTPVRPGTGGSAGAPKPSATGASGGPRATA